MTMSTYLDMHDITCGADSGTRLWLHPLVKAIQVPICRSKLTPFDPWQAWREAGGLGEQRMGEESWP